MKNSIKNQPIDIRFTHNIQLSSSEEKPIFNHNTGESSGVDSNQDHDSYSHVESMLQREVIKMV